MRGNLLVTAAVLVLAAANTAAAQSLFDGEWKADVSAAKYDPRPDVFTLSSGTYACRSCIPPYAVAADGKFHAIPGHPYVDDVAITIVDPRTVREQDRKDGKVTGESVSTVSADGKTLTSSFTDRSAPNGKVVTGKDVATRVGAALAGSHAISGSWRRTGTSGVSDDGVRFTIHTHADHYSYSDPTGFKFDGRYGGPYTPIVGDPAHAMGKIEKLNATTLRETIMVAGKVTGVSTISVSADGKTMTNVSEDLRHHTKSTFIARKV